MYRSALRSQSWTITSGYVCRHCRHHLSRQQTASQTRHESTQAQAVAGQAGYGAGDEEFINSFNSLSEDYSTKSKDKSPARAGVLKAKRQSQPESVTRHDVEPSADDDTEEGVVRKVLGKSTLTAEKHEHGPMKVETAFQRGTSTTGLDARSPAKRRDDRRKRARALEDVRIGIAPSSTLGDQPQTNAVTDSEAVRQERAEFERMMAGLVPEASPQQQPGLEFLIDKLQAREKKPTAVDAVSVHMGILAKQVEDEGTVQARARRHVEDPDASSNTPGTTALNRKYAFGARLSQSSAAAKQRELNSRPGWGDSASIPAKANKASFDTLREADKVSAKPVIRTAGELTAWGTEPVYRGKQESAHRTGPAEESFHRRQVHASRDAAGAVAYAADGLGPVLSTMAVSQDRVVAEADKEIDVVKHRDSKGLAPLDLVRFNEEPESRERDGEMQAFLRDLGKGSSDPDLAEFVDASLLEEYRRRRRGNGVPTTIGPDLSSASLAGLQKEVGRRLYGSGVETPLDDEVEDSTSQNLAFASFAALRHELKRRRRDGWAGTPLRGAGQGSVSPSLVSIDTPALTIEEQPEPKGRQSDCRVEIGSEGEGEKSAPRSLASLSIWDLRNELKRRRLERTVQTSPEATREVQVTEAATMKDSVNHERGSRRPDEDADKQDELRDAGPEADVSGRRHTNEDTDDKGGHPAADIGEGEGGESVSSKQASSKARLRSDHDVSPGPVPAIRAVTNKIPSTAATKMQLLIGKAKARRLKSLVNTAPQRVGAVPGMASTSTASDETVDVNGTEAPRLTRRDRAIITKYASTSLQKHTHGDSPRGSVEKWLASSEGPGTQQKGSAKAAEGRSTSINCAGERPAELHIPAEVQPAETEEQRSLADVMAELSKTAEAALPHEVPLAAPEPYETPVESSDIRSLSAGKLKITALNIQDQPPVPPLQYGLDRVLFNPGVYQMQDPLSRTYNFDPYLQKIMPIADFDFNALKEYKTSSADTFLGTLANEHGKKYLGSTSSMTGTLAHFHYLLSNWRPINLDMLSRGFKEQVDSFTQINRAPNSIFLRYKADTGTYAIDVDKEYDGANVLMMLGKSMEKLLTLPKEQYERYRCNNTTDPITATEREEPEAFEYTTMGDFLMRSQLDAHDARLPGTGMFDLKTRAVLPIRMDTEGYEEMLRYEIFTLQGSWESFEREYYDMLRSTMLKYMLQARMGRMEGIFLAYHNVERVFGFQYMPMMEIDRAMHGQVDPSLGDQEFRLSLKVLNEALEMATAEFPEKSLRMHFETAASPAGVMWIFAEPMEEAEIDEVQGRSKEAVEEFEAAVMGIEKKPKVAEEASEVSVEPPEAAEEALGDEEAMVRAAEKSVSQTSTLPMEPTSEDAVPQSTDGTTTAPESKAKDAYNEEAYATTTTSADPVFIGHVSSAVEDNLKPLFAATLILQNIVNGKPCEHNRPRDLKRTDEWEMQYILKQTPLGSAEKWARYQGVKARKKSVFSKVGRAEALVGAVDGKAEGVESKEMETGYRRMLKEMVARGRRFRKAMDGIEERMGSEVKRVDVAASGPSTETSSVPELEETGNRVHGNGELRGDSAPGLETEKVSTAEADDITAASEPAAASPDSATKIQSPSVPGVEEMGNGAHENGELPGDSGPVVDAEKASTTEDHDATAASGRAAAAGPYDSAEKNSGSVGGYMSWLYRKMIIDVGRLGAFPADLLLGRPYYYTYQLLEKNEGEASSRLRIVPPSELNAEVVGTDDTGEVESPEDIEDTIPVEEGGGILAEPKNNRLTVDSTSRQTLTQREIEDLKESSAGQEVIAKILAHHAALDEKTVFSKAKYMVRKRSKYLKRFTVLPMEVGSLIEYLLEKEPGRIMEMREETVGLVGAWSNAHYSGGEEVERDEIGEDGVGRRWLVVDETGGLVVAALAERMGILRKPDEDEEGVEDGDTNGERQVNGHGTGDDDVEMTSEYASTANGNHATNGTSSKPTPHRDHPIPAPSNTLTVLHPAVQPNLSLLKYFGYDTNIPDPTHPLHTHLKTLSWLQLLYPTQDPTYTAPPLASPTEIATWKSGKRSTYWKKHRRHRRCQTIVDETRSGSFAGLVIASPMDPAIILPHTLPLIRGGGTITIYSPTPEPLVTLIDLYSKDRRAAFINLLASDPTLTPENVNNDDFPLDPRLLLAPTLQTSRARAWQVLPGRTHPVMTSRGGSEGFVFTARRVVPLEGGVDAKGNFGKRGKRRGGVGVGVVEKGVGEGDGGSRGLGMSEGAAAEAVGTPVEVV
ncbi:hypothetical protein LTS00_002742 [Friedmanniomyces endolithicus]|nr:hypothetical protein LTS00_002742 [Friedmanniomyces endolithicus]